ncbi:U3 snoRNP protein [Datura stramonium]|uniref:U3 snoRNP protein n=1 Tax=Datura stramonium TaxID=4076 RepID=A0ABS8UJP0_DATST|nr:U3 snoRNP protein [Datura stramonium]
MATHSDAYAVKSLNKSPGRRRFTFKTFSERIEDVDIDVYRNLDPLKAEPSEGSSFFRDCLTEWRELNTAEDFISFYEEIFPLVQTLPQIILQKDLIVTKLLSRLDMKGRLSLEPILRLIAALSRDLLEDFLPFLQRIADSLVGLLKSGADREPDIIEQIFKSWSFIMMYLQKYLVKDVVDVLKVTTQLRYYSKEYVHEFMADSVSFILRNAPVKQLIKGVRKLMFEVAKNPLEIRKSAVSSLLWYVVRGSSSRLHSRAEQVLRLLIDKSLFVIGDQFTGGAEAILEVLVLALQRLCEELEATELELLWVCLYEEITECVSQGHLLHLGRLLSLLVSTLQVSYIQKISDYQRVLQLIQLLVQSYILPYPTVEAIDQTSNIVDKVMQSMLCILDGLYRTNNISTLSSVSMQWAPVFDLRNKSLLSFIEDLLLKDLCIIHFFKASIISALNDMIEISEEEVIHLLQILFKRLPVHGHSFLDDVPKEKLSRIHNFVREAIGRWIRRIQKEPYSIQIEENELAILWGIVGCYPSIVGSSVNGSLLMDLVNALDELLSTESADIAGHPRTTWQSLVGAALTSYYKSLANQNSRCDDSVVGRFLDLARKHKTCSQVLSPVADILDSVCGSIIQADASSKKHHPELVVSKTVVALGVFAANLSHHDKNLRLSTLRILCHYEPLTDVSSTNEQPLEKKMRMDNPQTTLMDYHGNNVIHLLLLIEETPLSIATSRKVILLISKIQMSLSAGRVAEEYMPVVLSGIIGIFHNRFSYLWNPTLDCIAVLLSQYFGLLWDRYIEYLDHYLSVFLGSHDEAARSKGESLETADNLNGSFRAYVFPVSDGASCATIFSLLIQCLQKIPSVAESRSRQIIPLFLKFLGYSIEDLKSVELYNQEGCKGKEWKNVLQEWLSLFRLMRNPRSFYLSQFFKEVLLYRLLQEDDADLQSKVLDCLLNWKDDFLLPYDQHLKNLINSKSLREELTTWSLSRESELVDTRHRASLVPVVIRILAPKVRKLKALASRKHASVHHRKAILGFLAQLDVEELPLFFALLIKPLVSASQGAATKSAWPWTTPETLKHGFDSFSVLEHFSRDCINAISWKKRYGFLHVIEDIVSVFDEVHIGPFLDLLMGCIVRLLDSCTSTLEGTRNDGGLADHGHQVEDKIMSNMAAKQCKDLRSLCLKIISFILSKYEDHDFSSEFWDLFFMSVKPLVASFKQEGASSEKPSSLFSCFLAMSRSSKLVPLLSREQNLVPDIFSMLAVSTASDAIVSSVLKFVENLLDLDVELGNENNPLRRFLLPHVDVLVCSLHRLFVHDGASKRKIVKYPGEKELNVFKLLSKHIKGPLAARKFLDILLPLLSKRSKDPEMCVGTLQIIKDIVEPLGSESSKKIVKSVSPLIISAGLDVRTSICDVLDAVAVNDSSVHPTANLLRELNATSTVELGDLDYDTVIAAYEKISADFFRTVPEEHVLIILSHAIHDMASEDLILRQSAYRLLLSFVEFSSQMLGKELKSEQESSGTWIRHILSNFFLKHMGTAMNKEDTVQKVWIDLLRDMVLKLPTVEDFKSFAVLYSEDPEQDFFNNIVHLQRHRRARALLRFKNVISSGNLSKVLINKVFIPLLFKMLLDGQVGKGENIRSACLEAVGSISKFMEWRLYYALLNRCFREITMKPDKQKVLLRLISSILDQFHFSETTSDHDTKDSVQDIRHTCLIESGKVMGSSELAEIQMCLQKDMLPRVHKMLTADTDNLNVNTSLILLKLLKLLPGDIMESHLPSIMHRIANFLKNRLESVRDEARAALAACLKELGLEYLQFVVKVLRGTLKRGFELHVLGFTLNFLLSKFLLNPSSGKLDYCLEDLLSVAVNDILSDISEEKEVEKIASKMKETRKQKSYDTLKLIAQSITFKTHALKLLAPILKHLQKQMTPKVKSKLENMLSHIAAGIQCNPSVNQTELFIFGYGLIKDGIRDESPGHAETSTLMEGEQKKDVVSRQIATSDKLVSIDPRYSHLITEFALGVLQNFMKNMKFDKKDEQLLSMLDPFVRLFGECLNSKYENVMSSSLRCLSPLVRLPLPSLESQAEKIKNSLLNIAQGSVTSSNPLLESCVKLLTVLLRSTKITLSTDQLHMLIQFPLFVDLERNPSFVALSLLKAIVSRKLVVAEIYDIVKRVAELMVTSQVESIRKKSSQILLQFLLDYHISEKRLQQHLDFLLSNLRYEHSTGREAILEMLHAIIMKFPVSIIDEQSQMFFLHLVVCLANDRDNKVRSMTGTVIKLLVGRISPRSLQSILEFSRSWYLGDKPHLWSAAAQVLGLLIEVLKDGFQKYIDSLLPVMRNILQSAVNVFTNKQVDLLNDATIPSWKEAYYSLVLFEKILNQFPKLCFRLDLEDLWEAICELLLHPHLWLRNISNRLVAFYFATVTEACKENVELPQGTYFLMRPSRLFFIATSLCCQLKVLQTDAAASDLIAQNLVFSICSLHSFLGKNECKDRDKFWSTIERVEQGLLLKAFQQLDSGKGKNIYLSLVADLSDQEDERQRYLVISYLLKTMGKISLHVEDMQMKIIFNCFKSVSPKLIDQSRLLSPEGEVDCQSFAYYMMLPLYKVCEGYAGKVISDDVKQMAEEVRGSISNVIGMQSFVQIYSHIRKNLKTKRDKRKQEEKVIAVVNPMRNAKRKLRIAEKHKAHKKRKMMAMKMGRWMQ